MSICLNGLPDITLSSKINACIIVVFVVFILTSWSETPTFHKQEVDCERLKPCHVHQLLNRATLDNWYPTILLKAVDTIGSCQRLAFTVGVSQHMLKITNLWKFERNRSSNLRDNNERTNTLVTLSCVRLDSLFRVELRLSLKLWHFRRSRFSQTFYTINLSYYSSPSKVVCQ